MISRMSTASFSSHEYSIPFLADLYGENVASTFIAVIQLYSADRYGYLLMILHLVVQFVSVNRNRRCIRWTARVRHCSERDTIPSVTDRQSAWQPSVFIMNEKDGIFHLYVRVMIKISTPWIKLRSRTPPFLGFATIEINADDDTRSFRALSRWDNILSIESLVSHRCYAQDANLQHAWSMATLHQRERILHSNDNGWTALERSRHIWRLRQGNMLWVDSRQF